MKQRYDSYKSTGIHWIPIIPSHWQISSVGKHYQVILGKMLCPKPIDASYTLEEYYCAGDVHFDGVNNLNLKQMWFSPEEKDKYLVKDKDLLIVEGGAGAGGCALARVSDDAERYIQNSILIARHPKNSTALLKYIIENFVRAGYIDGVCNEATFAHFTKEKVSHVPYPLMPYAEQEVIAAWLDEKCEEIDAAIAKVDREIELIDELKQSEISRVVTRGLNPDAPLRPSGIDWLGDIPKHWKIEKGKYLLQILPGFPADSNLFVQDDDAFPLIRIRDIDSDTTEINYSGEVPENYIITKGDILVGMDGDFNIAQWKGPNALLNQRVCKISGTNKVLGKYAFYVLPKLLKRINDVKYATTVKHLSTYDILNSKLPVPLYSEQQAIADYLDKKCTEIDGLKAKLTKKREALTELRQSIISEVVTGKRKII